MRTLPVIGHLDADCFYVSAERVRDEFLLGKPVGVLGNQGACVIAKSYEMKAAGVGDRDADLGRPGEVPVRVYVKRDSRWYEVLSRLMLEVVREWSPRVEYYSIDEFFFGDTRLARLADGSFDAIIIAMAGVKRLGRIKDVKFVDLMRAISSRREGRARWRSKRAPIAKKMNSIARFRLLMIHAHFMKPQPSERFSPSLALRAQLPSVCRRLCRPMQSGPIH